MAGRRYAFLDFQSGVDYQHVNKRLLADLNRLGMALGKVITVTSGYRTYAQQASLYALWKAGKGNIAAKPGHSAHESGLAVDAVIGGTALSSAVSSKMLAKYGLVAPVRGDPVHIQLAGKGVPAAAQQQAPQQSAAAAPAVPGVTPTGQTPDLTIPAYQPVQGPPAPDSTVPGFQAPGSGGNELVVTAQRWQQIASQDFVSPESQIFAQKAQAALGGQ